MKRLIRVKKISVAIALATVASSWNAPVFAQPVMEEVVLQARLKSSAEELIGERMDDDVVMDFIDSEFISRVGDSTVAGALRRVSGLSLVNDKFVYVRGLGERYSSTLLNGSVIPSPDLTRSVIPLDLFPTTIVESLAVQKVYSPDMPAAFGGGSVDIRTKGIPDDFTYGIDVGIGVDSENESKHLSYDGGSDDEWGTDDGTRALSGFIRSTMNEYQGNVEVQNLLSAMQSRDMPNASLADAQLLNRELAVAMNRNLSIQEEDDDPNYELKGHIGNNFYLSDEWEFGFLAGASYKRGWDDTESTARNFQFPDERFEIERESNRKTDLHGNINLGLRFTDDHRIETLSMYLRNTDDETAIRDYFNENREKSDGIGFREYRITFEERDLTVNQIMGEHYFGAATREKLPDWGIINWLEDVLPEESKINWKYSESRAATDIPNEVTIAGTTTNDPITGAVLSSAVDLDTRAAVYRFTDLQDKVENGGWSWVVPLITESSVIELSGGYEWNRKHRLYEQQQFSIGAFRVNDPSVLEGPLSQVFSEENILDPTNDFIFGVPGANNQSYIAATMTDAVFGKLDWTYDETWRVMLGLRWEDYSQVALDWNINGYSIENPQVTTDVATLEEAVFKEDEIYPSIAVTYMTEWWAEIFQLRFGYSETVVRPDLREITDSGYIDPITDALVLGNPGVIPSDIKNYDIRAEWFFDSGDNLTVSFYLKDIQNPIEFFEAAASDTNTAREIINAEEGEVYGMEIEGLKSLGFLGDWGEAFFLQGNVTIQESEITAGAKADAPTNNVRELTGASEYVVNAIIGYDSFNSQHAATLSYNVFGERLFVAGRNGAPDGYEQPFHSLDFTYTWFPTDYITLKLRLRNLLDKEITIEREGVETFTEAPGQIIAVNFQWDF
ncbi:MAG: TonB-dependent receptor [Pseudomonadales bacterium]|nr:TonB-dependent receptor [Pseudomonadales bacterium]